MPLLKGFLSSVAETSQYNSVSPLSLPRCSTSFQIPMRSARFHLGYRQCQVCYASQLLEVISRSVRAQDFRPLVLPLHQSCLALRFASSIKDAPKAYSHHQHQQSPRIDLQVMARHHHTTQVLTQAPRSILFPPYRPHHPRHTLLSSGPVQMLKVMRTQTT